MINAILIRRNPILDDAPTVKLPVNKHEFKVSFFTNPNRFKRFNPDHRDFLNPKLNDKMNPYKNHLKADDYIYNTEGKLTGFASCHYKFGDHHTVKLFYDLKLNFVAFAQKGKDDDYAVFDRKEELIGHLLPAKHNRFICYDIDWNEVRYLA